MNDIVSFDFDGTLSRVDVRRYCQWLLNGGVDVWVVTSRYDENSKHLYPLNPTNEDMYSITDSLGIDRSHIIFTNMQPKAGFLAATGARWHLDDDINEVSDINKANKIPAIWVNLRTWQDECNKRLLILKSQSK